MGIQVTFRKSDVEHVIVDTNTEHVPCYHCPACEDNQSSECQFTTERVAVKLSHNGSEIWVHQAPGGEYLWVDANVWGRNREVIIPMLDSLGVEFTEG